MHATDFHDQFTEWQHRTRLSAAWAGGHAMRFLTGTSVSALVARGANLPTYLLATGGIGLSIGVRVYMVNQEHEQQIKRLGSLYREEIASYLGIEPAQLGEDALRKAAEQIPALEDALDRNDKRRMSKMVAWVGGGVIAGVVLMTAALPVIGAMTTMVAGIGLSEALAGAAVSMLAGTALFQFTKEVVEAVTKNLLHITEPTAHDQILQMVRELRADTPHPITKDQVFDVLLAANPVMAEQLTQAMGKPFNKLDAVTRESVLKQYGEVLHLDQLADDLNNRQIRPQELMFIAVGKASGIARLDVPPLSQSEQLEQVLHQEWAKGREKAGYLLNEGKERAQALHAQASAKLHHAREVIQHEGLRHGWLARTGKDHPTQDQDKSWVERSAAQSNSQEVAR